MRFEFMKIATFSLITCRLISVAIAKPIQNRKADGMAIPLTRHPSSPHLKESIDLDAITSHGISIRENILRGLDNYEMNTGMMHPFAIKRSESRLGGRDANLPLKAYRNVWMAEISIGTPPETLNVHVDTGAADMWILQTGCDGISADVDLWDPYSSDTAKYLGQSFQIKYGDGTIVEGHRYNDSVTIAGFTSDPQTFGSVTSYTSQLKNNGYADGLLGLAFPSISNFRADTLITSLVKQNKLVNPTFSLKLTSPGGEMYVGGANSMLYSGDIAYTPVTNPGFWQVSMDDVRVNGDPVLENIPAIFDTGASYIFGDWNRVSELYKRFGGTLQEKSGFGYYYLPCNSFPTVSLTFSGKTFQIPPETLKLNPIEQGSPNCFSAIVAYPLAMTTTTFWDIGMPFLQSVYTVFDYGKSQVGIAKLT